MSCTSSRKEVETYDYTVKEIITVKLLVLDSLKIGQENIQVDFEVQNKINDTIIIPNPTCFGIVVYPIMRDPGQKRLQVQLEHSVNH